MRILAVVAEAPTARACLEGAWAAAGIVDDAVIEVLHVKVDPKKLVEAPEEIAIQKLREEKEGTADRRALAVKAEFDAWLASHPEIPGQRIRWVEKVGPEETVVRAEARDADLTVLARPHDLDAHDAMHTLVYGAERPLLMPADWQWASGHKFARHMAIAWKDTPQARLAIQGAAPWLAHAADVTVLTVGEDAKEIAAATALLKQLGITYRQVAVEAHKGKDLADQILAAATEAGADTLVLGAYRHNEIIEWALGSTTREIISKAPMPLFLAH